MSVLAPAVVVRKIPSWVLPEIMFPAPVPGAFVSPPIVLPLAWLSITTPL